MWDRVGLLVLWTSARTLSPHSIFENTFSGTSKESGILTSSHTSTFFYLMHCWLLQPMAEPERCVPHWVNDSPSCRFDLAAWLCIMMLHICEIGWTVWSLCPLTCSLGSLSLTSGVRWPAWSRATAVSLSSAPPPPPPVSHSPARWSPGRNWKLRTSILTVPSPSTALTINTEANSPPTLPRRLWTLFLLHSQSLWNWSMLAQTEDKEFKKPEAKRKKTDCVQFKGLIFAQRSYIFRA